MKPPSAVAVHVYGAVERKVHRITIIIIIYILIFIAMFAITRVRKNILSFLPQSSRLLRGAYVVAVKATMLPCHSGQDTGYVRYLRKHGDLDERTCKP